MGVQRVKITKDGVEATCMPASVAAWERNGWTRADDGSSGEAAVPAAPATPTPKTNPADNTEGG